MVWLNGRRCAAIKPRKEKQVLEIDVSGAMQVWGPRERACNYFVSTKIGILRENWWEKRRGATG